MPFSCEQEAYPPRFHRFQNVPPALCEWSIKNVSNQSLISEVILYEGEVKVKLRFVAKRWDCTSTADATNSVARYHVTQMTGLQLGWSP